MSRLETSIENSFGDWLSLWYPEWVYRKFTPMGDEGWPDRDLFGPGARTVFIEWKKKGKRPGLLQWERINRLRKLGHTVYVWDNLKKAKDEFRDYLHTQGLPIREH